MKLINIVFNIPTAPTNTARKDIWRVQNIQREI